MSDSATISTPFIFLRPLNRRDIGSKKALLGTSVSNLMNIANKLFKQYGTIKAIYTEAGQLVKDMDQVVPNATYYVSTIEPDLRRIEGNEINRTFKPKKPITQTKANPAFNKLFGTDTTFNEETRKHYEEQNRLEQEKSMKQEAEQRAKMEQERQDKRRQEEERRKSRKAELHKQFDRNRQRKRSQNSSNSPDRNSPGSNQNRRLALQDESDYDYDDFEDNNKNGSPSSQKSSRSNRSTASSQRGQSRNGKSPAQQLKSKNHSNSRQNSPRKQQNDDEYYSDDYYDYYDGDETNAASQKSSRQSSPKQQGRQGKSSPQSSKQKQQQGSKGRSSSRTSSPSSRQQSNQSKKGSSQQNNRRRSPNQKSRSGALNKNDDEYYSDEYYDDYYSDDEQGSSPRSKKGGQKNSTSASKKQVKITTTPTTRGKSKQANQYANDDDEFVFNDDEAYNFDEGDSPTLKSAIKNLEQQEDNDQFVFDDSAPRSATIDTIFTELLGEHEMNSKIWDALDQLKKYASQFIDNSPNLEIKQENSWFTKIFSTLKQQFTLADYSSIKFKDILANSARQLIHNHHFPVSSNISYSMKVAVVGPRHSGKSTYLTVLAHELFADLVASGGWKHTFIFFANLQIIHALFHTFEGIYNTICDITFDMLGVQKPILDQYVPTLKKYFASILTNKNTSPNFSLKSKFAIEQPALAQQFTKLARKIWSAYHDPLGMTEFLSLTFLIPRFVSSAAGFIRTFFILDNFECSSVNVEPKEPFSHPDNITTNLSEYWKFALERSNFIVSCEEQEQFFDILPPYSSGGIDFSSSLEFISTLDMADDKMFMPSEDKSEENSQTNADVDKSVNRMTDEDKKRAESVLNVTLNGYKQPFKFTFSMCGGCVAFISQWFELIEEIENYERIVDNDDVAKEEKRLEVVSQVQQVIDDLFISKESPRKTEETQADRDNAILVTNVTRSTK